MIIDKILDLRANPESFDAFHDGHYIYEEAIEFGFGYIADAFDCGTNKDCQKALCRYIDENDYNPDIKEFINSFNWVD